MQTIDKHIRGLLALWLAWAVLVLGFQALVVQRFQAQIPDTVLEWTAGETQPDAHSAQPYLLEPFMNRQVAYDSEFYISIALAGYDDPSLRAVWLDPEKEPEPIWGKYPLPFGIPNDFDTGRPPGVPEGHVRYSLNYAFFPFYPLLIRVVGLPLQLFGLNPIAAAALAGVIVSLLGTLAAMLALYDLTREHWEAESGKKAAFYLIAFPTGFFLAMVHTEGLFVGLAFGALALLRRRHWAWAALLAACAPLTRAVGVALIIPFGLAWLQEAAPFFAGLRKTAPARPASRRRAQPKPGPRPDLIWKGALSLSPLLGFGLWYGLLGAQFRAVEAAFFSRAILAVDRSLAAWTSAFRALFPVNQQEAAGWIGAGLLTLAALWVAHVVARRWLEERYPRAAYLGLSLGLCLLAVILIYFWFDRTINNQRSLYYMFEFSAILLALAACAWTLRSMPGLSLFGLLVIVISFFSAVPQGMHRYILGVPSVFIMLGALGQNDEVFDRAWTLGSVLLMGLFATLFAFNFWVG
jgi:hypothetical protein